MKVIINERGLIILKNKNSNYTIYERKNLLYKFHKCKYKYHIYLSNLIIEHFCCFNDTNDIQFINFNDNIILHTYNFNCNNLINYNNSIIYNCSIIFKDIKYKIFYFSNVLHNISLNDYLLNILLYECFNKIKFLILDYILINYFNFTKLTKLVYLSLTNTIIINNIDIYKTNIKYLCYHSIKNIILPYKLKLLILHFYDINNKIINNLPNTLRTLIIFDHLMIIINSKRILNNLPLNLKYLYYLNIKLRQNYLSNIINNLPPNLLLLHLQYYNNLNNLPYKLNSLILSNYCINNIVFPEYLKILKYIDTTIINYNIYYININTIITEDELLKIFNILKQTNYNNNILLFYNDYNINSIINQKFKLFNKKKILQKLLIYIKLKLNLKL